MPGWVRADFDWTRWWRSCCGSDPVSCWTRSTAMALSMRVAISDTAHDLSVVIDCELSLAVQVTAVCHSSYNQLRQLRPAVRSLSLNATKTLVQAFISCRLDYCNSLLYGISDRLLCRLQSVQNAAARLVTGARRCMLWPHYTTVTTAALSASQSASRVQDCGTCTSVAWWSGSRIPCWRLSPSARRWSWHTVLVLRTHTKLDDRSFSAAYPWLWNNLPPGLWRPRLFFDYC